MNPILLNLLEEDVKNGLFLHSNWWHKPQKSKQKDLLQQESLLMVGWPEERVVQKQAGGNKCVVRMGGNEGHHQKTGYK